jgi:molybdopterin-guanine dinucleotide biosynthesis protein A/rhodanese-related sulfurtransferase
MPTTGPTWRRSVVADLAGAVLTGGESRRMGRDKALLALGGVALARRSADVLLAAGASPVLAVGGDLERLRSEGLDARADPHQGSGPVGGIATALRALTDHAVVVVVACDLAGLTPEAVALVAGQLGDADVAVPVVDGRLEPLCAAWRPGVAAHLERCLAGDDRSVRAALRGLVVAEVEGFDRAWVTNLNTPGEVIGHEVGQNRGMTDVPEIDVDELARRREGGAFVLDVRQPDEYEAGHVPGAVLVPLDQLEARLAEVPGDRPLLVICKSGGRSAAAVGALTAAGYDATNVAGGTMAWIDAGHPVVEGSDAG